MFASSVEIAFNLLSKLLAKFAYALRNESLILYTYLTGSCSLETQLTLGFDRLLPLRSSPLNLAGRPRRCRDPCVAIKVRKAAEKHERACGTHRRSKSWLW